jgi:flagellar motility protein MotE (MotC chaperone)
MKILLNPVVLAVLVIILFMGGFMGGLYFIGFFDPKPVHHAPEVAEKQVDPALVKQAEDQTKGQLEWLQKLSLELDRWGSDLKTQQTKIEEREAEIVKKENELKLEKETIEKLHKEIAEMKSEFEQKLQLVETTQEGNVQRLSKLYNAMDIKNAAQMMAALTDSQVVQLFKSMKDTRSAKILEAWLAEGGANAEKAQRVAEFIRLAMPPPEQAAQDQ